MYVGELHRWLQVNRPGVLAAHYGLCEAQGLPRPSVVT